MQANHLTWLRVNAEQIRCMEGLITFHSHRSPFTIHRFLLSALCALHYALVFSCLLITIKSYLPKPRKTHPPREMQGIFNSGPTSPFLNILCLDACAPDRHRICEGGCAPCRGIAFRRRRICLWFNMSDEQSWDFNQSLGWSGAACEKQSLCRLQKNSVFRTPILIKLCLTPFPYVIRWICRPLFPTLHNQQ